MTPGEAEFWDLFGEWGKDGNGAPLPLSVRTLMGKGSNGDVLAPPRSIPGLPQFPQDRAIRNSDGDETTSSTRIYAPLAERDAFAMGSLVMPSRGIELAVLQVGTADAYGLLGFVVVDLG